MPQTLRERAPETTPRAGDYRLGFTSLYDEVVVDELPVEGAVPEWLSGTLVRNGPAQFEAGESSFRHWFDGQAMLHRFTIAGGRVSYANRFLDTAARRAARDEGRIAFSEFATDPCPGTFGRFLTRFTRRPSENAVVSVARVGERMVALTEPPLPVEFDPQTLQTLQTLGVHDFGDKVGGQLSTAHPLADPRTGELFNYVVRFSRTSEYRVYRMDSRMRRELVAKVPARAPAYMHSFALSERHVVLVEFPLVVNPLRLLLSGRPFIENYRWEPERGTRIVVIDRATGRVRSDWTTEPFFAFHHVNAFERDSELVVDLAAYDDDSVIRAFYLEAARRADARFPASRLRRLRIPLDGPPDVAIEHPAGHEPLELPRIDDRRQGADYRFTYGVGFRHGLGGPFTNQLVRLDVRTGETRSWGEPGCNPGEPVFVPVPGPSGDEDDGVLLSVVLDAHAGRSFLLVLGASSFEELARAEVPHHIPFGFHGQFV